MANLYVGVSSKARLVKNIYIGVNEKARKVQKAYIGVSGKARLFYSASTPFAFTYSGSYATEGNLEGNFVIRFKTSGTLKITNVGNTGGKLDVFCVGGGSAGNHSHNNSTNTGGGAGGGGYTTTKKGVSISVSSYSIVIGSGGQYNGNYLIVDSMAGGSSSGLNVSAAGGKISCTRWPYVDDPYACGFDGGSGGGAHGYQGGSDGSTPDDHDLYQPPGSGQGTTTREFGESSGKLYAGGGGGGGYSPTSGSDQREGGLGGDGGGGRGGYYKYKTDNNLTRTEYNASDGEANTGGGGGGCAGQNYTSKHAGSGGSGIVCIRNAR